MSPKPITYLVYGVPFSLSLLFSQTSNAVVTYGLDAVATVNSTVNDFIIAEQNSQVTFEPGATILGTNGADVTLLVEQNSTVQINGGTFANDVVSLDNATVTVNGGTLSDDLIADFGGQISVTGGLVTDDVEAFNLGSSILLTGGNFVEDVEAAFDSNITIQGGNYSTTNTRFRAANRATITIYGTGFEIDGSLAPDGVIAEEFGILTGTLIDGSPFDVFFDQNPSLDFDDPLGDAPGTILLVTVPEPSSALLCGALTLWWFRRNRNSEVRSL